MKLQSRPLMGFVVLLILACSGAVTAQTDWSKVQIKTTKVAGAVYMLEGGGGNIGVSVGPDGILIVDDQFAPLADKIRAALKTLGEGKLKFILNTHYHADHTRRQRSLWSGSAHHRPGKRATASLH